MPVIILFVFIIVFIYKFMSTVLSIKDTSIICGHHPNGLHRPNCGYCLHHWSCGCYYPMRTSWSCANCPMMRNG